MPKLSEILTEDNWFKGIVFSTGHGTEPKDPNAWPRHCLGTALDWQCKQVAAIIERLYPERVWTGKLWGYSRPVAVVVGFNNHPATTWTEIEKVMREYEIEQDLV